MLTTTDIDWVLILKKKSYLFRKNGKKGKMLNEQRYIAHIHGNIQIGTSGIQGHNHAI